MAGFFQDKSVFPAFCVPHEMQETAMHAKKCNPRRHCHNQKKELYLHDCASFSLIKSRTPETRIKRKQHKEVVSPSS